MPLFRKAPLLLIRRTDGSTVQVPLGRDGLFARAAAFFARR